MKLVANKDFSWAHQGVTVEHFKKDALIETEDKDLIGVSLAEGWTRKPGVKAATKAIAAAPENKAETAPPETKEEPGPPADGEALLDEVAAAADAAE